jgi:uncharacterized membrane protein YkvA (DUF1232 family)
LAAANDKAAAIAIMIERARNWARLIKRDVHVLYLAGRDPRVPWYAKALAIGVAGYALSPLDLIPDFIPVLGLIDDLILVPLGVLLALRLIPPEFLRELRAAAASAGDRPVSRMGGVVIVMIWIASIGLSVWLCYRLFGR